MNPPYSNRVDTDVDVVVIGAGITGLAAAYRLKLRGLRVALLESSDRAGGVIRSERRDGHLLEHGPFSVMARSTEFRELLYSLGLDPVRAHADGSARRFVQRRGRLHLAPTSPGALLRSSLLSPLGKARVIAGMLRSASRTAQNDISLDEFVRRRLGREAAERLAGPGAVGIFAAEATELGLDACLPRLGKLDFEAKSMAALLKAARREGAESERHEMITFQDGLTVLTEALSQELAAELQLDQAALRIEIGACSRSVVTASSVYRSRCIVTAVGVDATCHLVSDSCRASSDALRATKLAGLGVVHLLFDRHDVAHPLDGFGYLVAQKERLAAPVLGVIWPNSVFPGGSIPSRVLLRAMVGGTRWPEALDSDDADLTERVIRAIRGPLQLGGRPVWSEVARWPATVPVYEPGYSGRSERVVARIEGETGIVALGSWRGGLGVNDRVSEGWRAADRVADRLYAQGPVRLGLNTTEAAS